MAMNKAEREHVAALVKALAEVSAFRRTEPVYPDLPAPANGAGTTNLGFLPHVYGPIEFRAEPCASTSIGHYRYHEGKRSGGVQRGVSLCSSRLLALQVARNQLERNFAQALARLDAEIEAERANPTPHPERDA